MIRFDFNTYTNKFIDNEYYNELMNKKENILNKLKEDKMNGWMDDIDSAILEDIKETSKIIKENYDTLVVIGIGGSFLGAKAFDRMMRKYFNDEKYEVIFAGNTLSSKYLDELTMYLNEKNFCINVISKSGTTMETSITFDILKDLLKRKYGEHYNKRIFATTSESTGKLIEEAKENNYKTFYIPENIGGRYSFLTPAHLLPLSLNYDIEIITKNYYKGRRLLDDAYTYAAKRVALFNSGKVVENFVVHEGSMMTFTEWIKQLFGETEGKDGKGLFPTSTLFTRDLHSLGQFIQEGNKILFETFIKVRNNDNYIQFKTTDLNTVDNVVIDSVERAHFSGNVPIMEIELDELNIENISSLIYFFHLSAAISGFMFEIDPFNQPGVEVYKEEVRQSLKDL